jgi:hypothetical protein
MIFLRHFFAIPPCYIAAGSRGLLSKQKWAARRLNLPQFKLKSTVGSSDPVGPEDALTTKHALFRLGVLKRPKEGFSPYPDQAMFDGIRKFQKQKGLLDDGIMRPNGQTAEKIAEDLAKRKPNAAINDNAAPASGRAVQANAKSLPTPIPQVKPEELRFPPLDAPLYVSKPFREEIAYWEARGEFKNGNGYGATNGNAIGRYQMKPAARVDAGVMKRAGDRYVWNGMWGLQSDADFLKNSKRANRIQDHVFDRYVRALETQLRGKGAYKYLGKVIRGQKTNIRVTLSGQIAAALHHGAGGVNEYLKFMEKHGWDSSKYLGEDPKIVRKYTEIETRLRLFQNIPHQAKKNP